MRKRKLLFYLALFGITQTWAQTEWSNATALPTVAGTYKLTTDVTLSETWEAPAGVTTLDLNDHIVRRTFASDDEIGTVIYIEEGNTLTIEDNASAKTTRYWERGTYKEWTNPQTTGSGDYKTVGGCITGGRGEYNIHFVDGKLNYSGNINGSVKLDLLGLNIGGGYIKDTAPSGGGIINGGTLNLNGGNVVGNRVVGTEASAGGIMNAGSMVIGEGAAVLGNAVNNNNSLPTQIFGGGLLNSFYAKSCVNNGRIEYNHMESLYRADIYGAGVLQTSSTEFINNGSISYNTAFNSQERNFGLGLAILDYQSEYDRSDGVISGVNNGTIAHNSAYSGYTYGGGVSHSYGSFTNNGIITKNVANQGGGIILITILSVDGRENNVVFNNTGTISDNTALRYGGGICSLYGKKTITLNAGTKITGNVVTSEELYQHSGFGGGICSIDADGPITINNGIGTVEISDNKASKGGAGIYLCDTELNLKSEPSGKLTIMGNTLLDGTTASNVLLYKYYGEAKINIYDNNSLKNTATSIGVGIRKKAANGTDNTFAPASGVVTTGYGKHSTEALEHFQLDEALYEGTLLDIYKNSDNEVEIGLKVNDTGSNDTGLSKYAWRNVGVKLSRTIIGDGYYNTICLPFDVDNATLKKRFGNDVELKEMVKSEAIGTDIDLNFTSASSIEAGKPYIIKVSQDVVDPTFTDVTIKRNLQPKETELCTFVPVFNQTRLENDNKKILFLDAGNTLTWPSSEKYTADFRGLRCYFQLKNEVGASISSAKTFRLAFDDETTGIENVNDNDNVNDNYGGNLYNLQGQRVNRAGNGIYIKNGKKFVK